MPKTAFITFSGFFGGMTKAISSGFTQTNITFAHMIEVAVYACISAFFGYFVKILIDKIRKGAKS